MTVFSEALERIAERVPETQVAIVMGADGIPVEKLVRGDYASFEAIAAEYTTLLRNSVSVGLDAELGDLGELAVATGRTLTVLMAITPEYYIFAAFAPGALLGRARFALRLASLALKRELV